jgi:hypothetical protein
MHLRTDPISSPHATMVSAALNLDLTPDPSRSSWFSYIRIVFKWLWRQLSVSWRFMWGMKMPQSAGAGVPYMNGHANGNAASAMYDANGDRIERYQQLNMWYPDEMDSHIVVMYSPVHALIWTATTGSNWILMMAIMIIVSAQVCGLFCSPLSDALSYRRPCSADTLTHKQLRAPCEGQGNHRFRGHARIQREGTYCSSHATTPVTW